MKLPSFFTLLLAATFQAKLTEGKAFRRELQTSTNAQYPNVKFTRRLEENLWPEQAKIVPEGPLESNNGWYAMRFGETLALGGNTMVIGVPRGDAMTPNGSTDYNSGEAYLYVRNATSPTGWSKQARIYASDHQHKAYFGASLGVDGDTVIAGAPQHYYGNHATYGMQSGRGAVYVFVRNTETNEWTEHSKLVASDAATNYHDAQFGAGSAIQGDTIVVGAWYNYAPGTTTAYSGGLYVFNRDPQGQWIETQLFPSEQAQSRLGSSIAIHGDTFIAAAGGYDPLVGGSYVGDAGGVYVFARNATTNQWSKETILTAGDPVQGLRLSEHYGGGDFPKTVGIYGDTVIVGAPHANPKGTDSGAAYIFVRDALSSTGWSQQAKLFPDDGAADDFFGENVAIFGNTVVIGSPLNDHFGTNSGAAYVYTRDADTNVWSLVIKLLPSDIQPEGDPNHPIKWDMFGKAVDIDGNTIAVGVPRDDESNVQNIYQTGYDGGAVYTFGAPAMSDAPTNQPTSSPTLPAAWNIAFVDIETNFTATSVEELSIKYLVGKDRTVATALYKDCDAKENITDIAIIPTKNQIDFNETHDDLTVLLDLNKTVVAQSSIWNATTSKIKLCQEVKLTLENSNDPSEPFVIATDLREIEIDFELSVNYTTNTSLAAGDIENADAATAVSSSVEACQCTEIDVVCTNEPLAPNSELFVCVKSIDDAIDVDELVSMIISQTEQNPFTVVNEKSVINPQITSLEAVSNKAIRVATRVPSNLFNFAAGEVITISGVINMKLVGSGRKLRALVGEATSNIDSDEEAAYELKIDVKGEADLALEDEVPIGNSGSTKAKELAALGMAVLASYLML